MLSGVSKGKVLIDIVSTAGHVRSVILTDCANEKAKANFAVVVKPLLGLLRKCPLRRRSDMSVSPIWGLWAKGRLLAVEALQGQGQRTAALFQRAADYE